MSALHLVKRFFGSFGRKRLTVDEQAWVDEQLLPGEQALWRRMSKADQRHAHLVARRTQSLLEDQATRPVLAAALLHDIGKVEAEVGTFLRVIATGVGWTATREQVASWKEESGWLGRAGRYLAHNEIGADLLREAGSDELTIKWAYEHELKHTEWTLPEEITDALWKADNA